MITQQILAPDTTVTEEEVAEFAQLEREIRRAMESVMRASDTLRQLLARRDALLLRSAARPLTPDDQF